MDGPGARRSRIADDRLYGYRDLSKPMRALSEPIPDREWRRSEEPLPSFQLSLHLRLAALLASKDGDWLVDQLG